jgi:D-alanyl-D-alanine carboxypeptidase
MAVVLFGMKLLQLVELLAAATDTAKNVQDIVETKRLQGVAHDLTVAGHAPTDTIPVEHEVAASMLNARLGNVWTPGSQAGWDADHSN